VPVRADTAAARQPLTGFVAISGGTVNYGFRIGSLAIQPLPKSTTEPLVFHDRSIAPTQQPTETRPGHVTL